MTAAQLVSRTACKLIQSLLPGAAAKETDTVRSLLQYRRASRCRMHEVTLVIDIVAERATPGGWFGGGPRGGGSGTPAYRRKELKHQKMLHAAVPFLVIICRKPCVAVPFWIIKLEMLRAAAPFWPVTRRRDVWGEARVRGLKGQTSPARPVSRGRSVSSS